MNPLDARYIYTQNPCGCLAILMVNDEAMRKYMARDLAREIREGRLPQYTNDRDAIPPVCCPEHPDRFRKPPTQSALGL